MAARSRTCISFFKIYFALFICLCWILVMAHRIVNLHCSIQAVVPWLEITPETPSLRAWCLSHQTTREVPRTSISWCFTWKYSCGGRRMDVGMRETWIRKLCVSVSSPVDTKMLIFPLFSHLSHVQFFLTPRTAVCQVSLSFTIPRSYLQFRRLRFNPWVGKIP